jgi:hypothetical protein
MSDSGSKSSRDSIDNYFDDEESIKLMMEAYDVSYADASLVWNMFIKTMRRAVEIAEATKSESQVHED